MFIGHYAPAFVVAALGPRAPRLGAMFVAAQLVDIAFFGFTLIGVEHYRLTPEITASNALDLYHAPYTHSLLGSAAFALGWAVVARLLGSGWGTAWLGGAVVLSHWLLDLIVHAPDLTLAGSPPRYGFALWDMPAAERALELTLVALAFGFYLVRTRGGRTAATVLALALLMVQAVNWMTPQPDRVIDPPPSSEALVAIAAFLLLAAMAGWTARQRHHASGPAVRSL